MNRLGIVSESGTDLFKISRLFLETALCILLVSLFAGCATYKASLRPVTIPIGYRKYVNGSSVTHDTLVILLPGINDDPKMFETYSFVNLIQQLDESIEVITVDAHYGYYKNHTIADRIYKDILTPALNEGIKNIWIAGVSLGGMGSLINAMAHPDLIKGVILVAPFLGYDFQTNELRRAGGLKSWNYNSNHKGIDDILEFWNNIKVFTESNRNTEIYLTYGLEDKYISGSLLLSEIVSPEHTLSLKGGHDWKTWKLLFSKLLQKYPDIFN